MTYSRSNVRNQPSHPTPQGFQALFTEHRPPSNSHRSTSLVMTRIETLEEFLAVWPEILEDFSEAGEYLPVMLNSISHGFLGVLYNAKAFCGVVAAGLQDRTVFIRMLPKLFGRDCVAFVAEWAQEVGATEIHIVSRQFNGSNFRFFEKTLGFHRQSVTFSLPVCQTQA